MVRNCCCVIVLLYPLGDPHIQSFTSTYSSSGSHFGRFHVLNYPYGFESTTYGNYIIWLLMVQNIHTCSIQELLVLLL